MSISGLTPWSIPGIEPWSIGAFGLVAAPAWLWPAADFFAGAFFAGAFDFTAGCMGLDIFMPGIFMPDIDCATTGALRTDSDIAPARSSGRLMRPFPPGVR